MQRRAPDALDALLLGRRQDPREVQLDHVSQLRTRVEQSAQRLDQEDVRPREKVDSFHESAERAP